ncbi:MAG: cytochrome C, partial [Proteobacteria bacterium]|nr:cytochrome C [Pseudomonadota bacterium]
SIKAADNPQNCYRCHESRFCTDCHSRTKKGNLNIKSHRKVGNGQVYDWNADHAAEARRNLQSCESCHPEADVCVQCHLSGGVNPHPKNWSKIKQRYKDTRNARTCKKCHITGSMF